MHVFVLYLVISFAGDALICIFYPKQFDKFGMETESGYNSTENIPGGDAEDAVEGEDRSTALVECCQRALECAMQLVKHVTEDLTSHIAIRYFIHVLYDIVYNKCMFLISLIYNFM